ncbi:hypothetical protein [Streptomyces sp. NPDC054865]
MATTERTTAPIDVVNVTDRQALWEMEHMVRNRLTELLLSDLEGLLRPDIKAARANGVWAESLIVRAGTHEVSRQQPWPVRFDSEDLRVNWEASGKLTVSAAVRAEVDRILFQLTQLHGGLIPGQDLSLRLPRHLY